MKHPRLLLFLCLACFSSSLVSGAGEVQVDADIAGVSVFLNNSYIGDVPVTIPGPDSGEYQIVATAPGYPAQVKNISFSSENQEEVFFTFGSDSTGKEPEGIKTYDCTGSPEKTGIRGTSISVVSLPGGELMAYYSGHGEGVRCAGSSDGSRWHEYPDGCLWVSGNEKDALPLSRPWVYAAEGGGFRMIYQSGDMAGPSLFRAFSDDGKRFTPEGEVAIHPLSDSVSPEQVSGPTGIRLSDGSLRMYYSPRSGGIRSAVSADDGKTWTEEEGIRLESATDPSVISFPDGRFGLFYVDLSAGSKGQKLMIASSSDGLSYVPSPSGTIIESDQKGVWVLDPDVYVMTDGKWMLFFSIMGSPGGTGITIPTIMKAVIDPGCLVSRLNQT